MKYGIWRHENALGNSAEHTVGLARHLKKTKDINPEIYVETEFQKAFAMCIPGIRSSNIKFFKEKGVIDYGTPTWGGYDNPLFEDICMPNVYPFKNTYKAGWSDLCAKRKVLSFPIEDYENRHNLPVGGIVVSVRELGTYEKRKDGSKEDLNRFVDTKPFIVVAFYYAEKGHYVA